MTTKTKPKITLKPRTGKLQPNADLLIAREKLRKNPPNRFSDFKAPQHSLGDNVPAPTMVTDAGTVFDASSLPINNCGQIDPSQLDSLVNSWFLGYPAYSILSQNGILQNIIQAYAQNSTRKWIEIKSRSKLSNEDKNIISKAITTIDNWGVLCEHGVSIALSNSSDIQYLTQANNELKQKTNNLRNLTSTLRTKFANLNS